MADVLLPASPENLLNLIAYAGDAVVSKTLSKTAGGTVTLFAFAAGQGLSEHTAPFDALVQVLDGQVELSIGGKPVLASAGEMVLMPANIPHALRAQSDFKMLLIMLRN